MSPWPPDPKLSGPHPTCRRESESQLHLSTGAWPCGDRGDEAFHYAWAAPRPGPPHGKRPGRPWRGGCSCRYRSVTWQPGVWTAGLGPEACAHPAELTSRPSPPHSLCSSHTGRQIRERAQIPHRPAFAPEVLSAWSTVPHTSAPDFPLFLGLCWNISSWKGPFQPLSITPLLYFLQSPDRSRK